MYPILQRFPNFLGCGPLLLLNIFRAPSGGLANITNVCHVMPRSLHLKSEKHYLSNGILWTRPIHTPLRPKYTLMISTTISIVLRDMLMIYLIFQQVTAMGSRQLHI